MPLSTAVARWRQREAQIAADAGSTCTITRPADPGGFDPETGGYDEDALTGPNVTDLYDGPCMIHLPGTQATETLAAGQEVIETRPVVKVPDLDTGFAKGDLITIVTSALDPLLPGVTLTVRDVETDDWTVWRRLVCEENE